MVGSGIFMAENAVDVGLADEVLFPCAHPGEESPLDAAHVGQRWFISWSSKLTETRMLVSGLPAWTLPACAGWGLGTDCVDSTGSSSVSSGGIASDAATGRDGDSGKEDSAANRAESAPLGCNPVAMALGVTT